MTRSDPAVDAESDGLTPQLLETVSKKLFSSVLGDVMDGVGLCDQFLPPDIRPLSDDMVVVGRAMTVLEADLPDSGPTAEDRPFGLMFEALDSLKPGEVYVASGSSGDFALWGGLMSTRAMTLGAAGAVLNGFSRDTREIRGLRFPTFSHGGYGQDQRPRGKVVAYRVPVTIGRVRIESGDLVFGDLDGVCIVPRARSSEIIRLALEKVSTENLVRKHILAGNSTVEAFERFGAM